MYSNNTIGLLRRLASIFYDCLLLFSLLFFGSFLALPFTSGEAIPSDNLIYPISLFCGCYFYFVWQWVKGGQTLGMRAWRCRLMQVHGNRPSWHSASVRFLLAIISWTVFGMGYWMALFRDDRKTFHDLYSNTYLILEPRD